MSYVISYEGDEPKTDGEAVQPVRSEYQARRIFRLPSIVKTALTFAAAAGTFYGAELYAPPEYRPSTVMGLHDARIASAVKAAELEQQARFDEYAGQMKLAVEQTIQQYKAATEGTLANYGAVYDRGKIIASTSAQIQTAYVNQEMQRKNAERSGDVAIINFSRIVGRGLDLLEEGSGNGAKEYADQLSNELSSEILAATRSGVQADLGQWNAGLPTPEQVRQQIESIKPLQLPLPPRLGARSATTYLDNGDPK